VSVNSPEEFNISSLLGEKGDGPAKDRTGTTSGRADRKKFLEFLLICLELVTKIAIS